MEVNLTFEINSEIYKKANINEKKVASGHVGTHFDVMNKKIESDHLIKKAIVFDVSLIKDRDINISDIEIELVNKDIAIFFYTGFIEKVEYGSKKYFTNHPEIDNGLIDYLLEKNISIIGLDFAGIRRGREHTKKDQYCANRGVFIIENLCNLNKVLKNKTNATFKCNIYIENITNATGLPCKVTAEI